MHKERLENIVRAELEDGLPENWCVPSGEFSTNKKLYDYQLDALRKAAQALYLYYGEADCDFQEGEPQATNHRRKRKLAERYGVSELDMFSIKKYETRAAEQAGRENPVFHILSEKMTSYQDKIHYQSLINRMCFWMATGSGKTLVMIKLIEYLHQLKELAEIPPYDILILAPSEHLIRQIRQTIMEFNQSGLVIDFVPLRSIGRMRQPPFGRSVTVYYHRSDNISDMQKEALIDWRNYENNGQWYILLDEAHKGGKDDSKRQAYYACMARNGFLFNFSATFTDLEDIRTTVKKYNLEEFIQYSYGKNIYIGKEQFQSFTQPSTETSHEDRCAIVLKSLITLAHISSSVAELRASTKMEDLYHLPLMLTLVNSVNTDIENERNDLWAFFQILREIAMEEVDIELFGACKNDLKREWSETPFLFSGGQKCLCASNINKLAQMKTTDLRERIFLSRRKSSLQLIVSKDQRELALQMKNADSPFALIRIGETAGWRNNLLAGYEETHTLQDQSFFDNLAKSRITILMGSRSFFESWDSNRPNVINFINIGGFDAKKFVVQSVGRGVRIETLPNQRRRHDALPDPCIPHDLRERAQLPETLFLFATNRKAIGSVLEGLEQEQGFNFKTVKGFIKAKKPKIGNQDMPLLVPVYQSVHRDLSERARFSMSEETQQRFSKYLEETSTSILLVRDGLEPEKIVNLRDYARSNRYSPNPRKIYSNLIFLQNRLLEYLSEKDQIARGVRELDEDNDIVHFMKVRAELSLSQLQHLESLVVSVAEGELSKEQQQELKDQFTRNLISLDEFIRRSTGRSEESFNGLKIKNVAQHYYVPIILGDRQAHYIQHVIKEESEVRFIGALEQWLQTHTPEWDAWSFSKLDESLDKIHIPYYDNQRNEYARFRPDFIFWMHRGSEYQIMFVDPKGVEHTSALRKIDGYQDLFEEDGKKKSFSYRDPSADSDEAFEILVSVGLLMFNEERSSAAQYQRFWTCTPSDIFRAITERTKDE